MLTTVIVLVARSEYIFASWVCTGMAHVQSKSVYSSSTGIQLDFRYIFSCFLTHDAYENTWKCGELKLYFSPSAGG